MSSFLNGLALIGAGTKGFMQGMDDAERRKREEEDRRDREEDRQFQRKQRARMEEGWNREDQSRAAMIDAAKPVPTAEVEGAPQQVTLANGGAGGAAQTFSTAPARDESPAAVRRRQAAAVRSIDPEKAVQLEREARSDTLADMQLEKAQRDHLNAMFDDRLKGISSPEQLAQHMSDTPGDGNGGNAKFAVVYSPAGKNGKRRWALAQVNPDGSQSVVGKDYEEGDKGMAEARLFMSKSVPDSAKLTYLHGEAQLAQQAQENQLNRDNSLAIAKANNATHLQVAREGRASAERVANITAGARVEAAGAKAHGGFERMPEHLKVQYKALTDEARDINKQIVAAQAQNMWDPKSDNARALVTRQRALEMRANALMKPYEGADAQPAGAVPAPAAPRQAATAEPPPVVPASRPGMGTVLAPSEAAVLPLPGPATAAKPATAAPAAARPAGGGEQPFLQFAAENIQQPGGKLAIAKRVARDYPAVQQMIAADKGVLASGAPLDKSVVAKIKQRLEANTQQAQMMEAFMSAEPTSMQDATTETAWANR
jgi:hypothetical protein